MVHGLCLGLIVVAPFALFGFALVWWELCRVMFIAGMFLAPVSVLLAWLFGAYCTPVFALFPNLATSRTRFGGLVPGMALPDELHAWAAVALFYAVVAVVLGAQINRLLRR